MSKLSKNFTSEEFSCKCGCGLSNPHAYLISVLQELRDHFGTPIKINSGLRCPEHNKAVGGVKHSRHLQGTAADIDVRLIPPEKVYKYLDEKYPDTLGLGLYNSFVHVDVRVPKARWDLSG